MSKVAATYWDNSRTVLMPRSKRAKTTKPNTTATPQWFVFAVVASITFMLCLTINLRAFSEMSHEQGLNESLSTQIETLTNENLVLQEEIHDLKNDERAIEREARKIGMGRSNEKILVPTN